MESRSTNSSTHKAGVATLIVTLVLGIAGVVAAQSGPNSNCSGDSVVQFGSQFFGLEDAGNRLLSTSPTTREFPLATSLPAGTYSLDAVSYDGYEQRETIAPQSQEQWYAEFLGSDGSVLATSGITPDLEDEVVEATWNGSLGEITLASPASAVRVSHAAPGSASVNSVRPVCIGATNTALPETTTTTAPEIVAGPSSVTVDYLSTARSSSTVSLTCGDLKESASGNEINISMSDIPASTGCVVEYPAALDCAMAIDPLSVTGASAPGIQNIVIPVAGDANASMTIDCVGNEVEAVTETPTTTVVKNAVEPDVRSKVETAPTATAQTGTPAFTG